MLSCLVNYIVEISYESHQTDNLLDYFTKILLSRVLSMCLDYKGIMMWFISE